MGDPGTVTFLITIDTEADNEWGRPAEATYEGVAALTRFQHLCDRYGARPTYLVTHDVATDSESARALTELHGAGRCEIGSHLHSWRTPPFEHPLDRAGQCHPYLHEYPPDLRYAKLECLTACLEGRLGVRPRSYRGGRWSLDEATLAGLARLGYLADTTVTPHISWRRHWGAHDGGTDFSREPQDPHRMALAGDGAGCDLLLEVPVTIRLRGCVPPRWYDALVGWTGRTRLSWALTGGVLGRTALGRAVWLHPAKSSARNLAWLVDRACQRGEPALNMMFHSSELVPGGAPWLRTVSDAARVWRRLEATLDRAAQHPDIRFAGLAAFAREWHEAGTPVAGS